VLQSPAQLTRQIEFYNPDWSRDGRTLLFESTLDGKFAVYVINVDGTGLRRLTVDTANNEQPRWSPDGRRIVFSSDRAGHLDLYVMNADGSGQTRLTTTSGGGYYQASFSPDDRWILFQGRPDNRETRDRVYLIRSDGSGSWRQLSDSTSGAEGPRWSRDGSITFKQVPYSKRFWNEMTLADMNDAKLHTRVMTVRPDGSGRRAVDQSSADDDKVRSPNGRQTAYTKSVDGASGLYVDERLLIGGPGAGPLGYVRTATLTPLHDTLDTYESPRDGAGPIVRGAGHYVVRGIRQVGPRRWEMSDTWYDSTGQETARQFARTASEGPPTIELETVRAPTDSASMLVAANRVTAWVVPAGAAPRLYDSAAIGERYNTVIVASAIAKTHPTVGSVFLYPAYTLYGGSPVQTRVDSMRVVRRDTLYSGQVVLPVLVLERAGGWQIWVDETTGAEVLSRGNAGPGRWWWHVRRGVTPPQLK
jgi:dipeptidyl aminopeptidase/acylaminoacyl peptidase